MLFSKPLEIKDLEQSGLLLPFTDVAKSHHQLAWNFCLSSSKRTTCASVNTFCAAMRFYNTPTRRDADCPGQGIVDD